MATKRPKISVIVDPDLKAALSALAAEDDRTVSKLCELVLRDYAQSKGKLPTEDTGAGK